MFDASLAQLVAGIPVIGQLGLGRWLEAGGWVMYPLLALSVTTVALSIERAMYWARTHGGGRAKRSAAITAKLAQGRLDEARAVAETDPTVYGRFAEALIDRARAFHDRAAAEAAAHDLIEQTRPGVERFATTLSTIITAAPMLGILGTVTGIIRSFRLLNADAAAVDPTLVAGGIAEALITTAFGLVIALVTLFPYAIFRAHSDRCFGRLEAIAAGVAATAERAPQGKRKGADDEADAA